MGIDTSVDLVLREMEIGGKKAALLFVDGFVDDTVATIIMTSLMDVSREEMVPNTLVKILNSHLPYVDVDTIDTLEEVIHQSLSGPMVLMVDGEQEALAIDSRIYPARQPEEPDVEKVTRGSRDGFVETMMFNIALVRRRLRDPKFRAEVARVGKRSAADVCLLYIEDITSPDLVDNVRQRIGAIEVDALPMAEKTLEEFMRKKYWNPFPEVRYTERPDVAAVHLLEGHVIVIVDNSPSVIIAPTTIFHHIHHAEEYRHDPIVGLYIRWVRLIGILISFLLVPLWLLVVLEPHLLPPALDFIGTEEDYEIPMMLQFIFAHLGIDLLRMASIHTPSPLAVALGLVGALLIGEIAVEVGFFVPEVLLYMGLVAVGIFSTPSWELGMANRLVLLFLILTTGIFRLPGLIIGLLLLFLRLATTKSFGHPYLWPLFPFHAREFLNVMVRRPVPNQRFRPEFLQTKDKQRTRPPGNKNDQS